MRLGERIGLLIRANLGRWRRDRDPAETALRRADKMEALLEQLGERLKRAMARQVQLEGQLRQAEEMARQSEQRADEALRANDEAAAREAIRHKLAYSQMADELRSSLTRHTAATQDLHADVAKLESRLDRARAKTQKPPAPATTPASQPATGDATISEGSSDEEVAVSLESLQERMSRVWSDEQIDNELEAIKSRLSAGMGRESD